MTDTRQTETQADTAAVERLAREVMGWELSPPPPRSTLRGFKGDPDSLRWWKADGAPVANLAGWDPFADANADLQVLERVRETWGPGRQKELGDQLRLAWMARWGYQADTPEHLRYQAGDYARAALAVLDAQGGSTNQPHGSER
jgi:hypothetical protein